MIGIQRAVLCTVATSMWSGIMYAAEAVPFLELRLHAPRIMQVVQKAVAEAADEEDGADALSDSPLGMVSELGIKQLQLFLYPDEAMGAVPVIICRGGTRAGFEGLIEEMADGSMEKVGEGQYRFIPEEGEEPDALMAQMRLWIKDSGAVLAPLGLARAWGNGAMRPTAQPVSVLASRLDDAAALGVLSVSFPETLAENLEEALSGNPLVGGEDADESVNSLLSMVWDGLVEPFARTKAFALKLGVKDDDTRSATYVHVYRDAADAAAAKAAFDADTALDDAEGVLATLLEVVDAESTRTRVTSRGTQLALSLAWTPEQDIEIGEILMGGIMELMFSGAMGVSISDTDDDGPVETRYTAAPSIDTAVDIDALKADLSVQLQSRLFPNHYWAQGDEPSLALECDYIAYPNSELGRIEYEVVGITAPDGTSIMRETDEGRRRLFNRREGASQIRLPVVAGTPKEKLGTGRVRVSLAMPTQMEILELGTNDVGRTVTQGGMKVTLKRIHRNNVSITFKGAESVKIFAMDETGRYLDDESSSWSGSSMAVGFHGMVSRVKIVGVTESADIQVEADVDLNQGERIELPEEPSDAVPVRYDYSPVAVIPEYTAETLASWQVAWSTAPDDDDFDGDLRVKIEANKVTGSASWKVCYVGADGPLMLRGNSGSYGGLSGASLGYYPHDGEEAGIVGVFGFLDVTFPSKVAAWSVTRTADGAPVAFATPSGGEGTARFDKNMVVVEGLKADPLTAVAVDGSGTRLKLAEDRRRDGVSSYRFWGVPTTISFQAAAEKVSQRLPIDLAVPGADASAHEGYKRALAGVGQVAALLETIDDSFRRQHTSYSDGTLAGAYYLFDAKGEPAKLIDEAIAHADPAGAERYGYKLTPYQGYYFSLAKGKIENKATTDYGRSKEPKALKWSGGEFQVNTPTERMALVAYPATGKGARLFWRWNEAKLSFAGEGPLVYVPADAWPTGWATIENLPFPTPPSTTPGQ
jgi:hypothetical protein